MKYKIIIVAFPREDPQTIERYIYEYIPGCYDSLLRVLAKCDKIQRGFDALKLPLRCDYEEISQ